MTVTGQLAFARAQDVVPDEVSGGALRRAPTRPLSEDVNPANYDVVACQVTDLLTQPELKPTLTEHGFAQVDLSEVRGLAEAVVPLAAGESLTPEVMGRLRKVVRGSSLPLRGGGRAKVLHVAGEGIIVRRAGPAGLSIPGAAEVPARAVHIDQDVDGTPLRQILRGLAPRLFHHDSPLHQNTRSRLHVLNLWIPLRQITAPLALLDRQTLNRREHQLRYGLPTDAFLERTADRAVNDIWLLLPDPAQRFYFTSEMDARSGYLFETMSCAHGSFVLPGEEQARELLVALRDLAAGKTPAPATPADAALPRDTTPALRRVIEELRALHRGPRPPEWTERLAQLDAALTRTSLEMRVVAWV